MEKEMENHRVVYAVGDNIITSLGTTTRENVDNIQAEKTGIKRYENASLFPEPFVASIIDDSRLKTFPLWEKLSNYHRLEKLMILSASDALQKCGVDASSKRTAFIFSTTKGNIDLIAKSETLNPDAELANMALHVSTFFKSTNKPYIISNACISGVLAILLGQRLLKSGEYDHVVLIGGDLTTEFIISGFMSFKSVSPNPCKPYDKSRDGLSMGEGAATLILSVDKSLVKDATPIMVAGCSSSNDANHISGPSRTGHELHLAITHAMQEAGLKASDIHMIDMHGTATVYNDEMESKAVGLTHLESSPLLSLKGYIGHTMGASGLIESVVCLEAIRRQMLFRTLGFSELGVPVNVNVTTETRPAQIKNILKTASGFGGCNAAVIFSTEKSGNKVPNDDCAKTIKECVIADKKVMIDGKTVFDGSDYQDYAAFIRAAFKSISEPYMKFSKMDDLCKLGLIATEFLLQGVNLHEKYAEDEISMLLANRYSSLDTDITHQHIIDDRSTYQLSPAVFVYTLANIVMGEVSIRNKFKGENLFLIDEKFDRKRMEQIASLSLSCENTKVMIVGWVDFFKDDYSAHLLLVEKK